MRIPPSLPPELQQALREVWSALDRANGPRSVDLHRRRMLNAGGATAGDEYLTRDQVFPDMAFVDQVVSQVSRATGTALSGTHAARLALSTATLAENSTWFETDRTVTYRLLTGKVWTYVSGVMVGLDGAWPVDLGTADTGFRYDATNTLRGYRWSGTAWAYWGPLDPPATIPETPNTPVPAHTGTGVSTTPTLVWVSARATTYDVYFGLTATPPLVSSGQATASYIPTGPLASNTLHYWKITAINVHGSTTGPVWSFTTATVALTLPAAPNTPSPITGATGVSLLPSLSWVSARATSYTISFGNGQFNSTAGWEIPNGDVDTNLGLANYTHPDEQALLTPESRVGPAWFTSPDEADAAVNTDFSTTASWEAAIVGTDLVIPGQTAQYTLADELEDTSPPAGVSFLPVPDMSPRRGTLSIGYFHIISDQYGDNMNAPATVGWVSNAAEGARSPWPFWAGTGEGGGAGCLGEAWVATSGDPHPTVPVGSLVVYDGGSTLPVDPPGVISGIECYSDYGGVETAAQAEARVAAWLETYPTARIWLIAQAYDRRIATETDLQKLADLQVRQLHLALTHTNIEGILWFSDGRAGGTRTYEWWRPIHGSGFKTLTGSTLPMTTWGGFTLTTQANHTVPEESTGGYLTDCGATDTSTPGDWLVQVGAQTAPPVSVVNYPTATWAPPRLAPSTTYPWMIQAHNASGSTSGPTWTFVTTTAAVAVPSTPTSPSPANTSTGISATVTLMWTANGATSCSLYFGTTATPPLAASGIVNARYSPPTLTAATVYYWKIRATNAYGDTDGPVWSFTVAGGMPAEPITPSPADGSIDVGLDTIFSWAPSANAAWYTIAFGPTYPPPVVAGVLLTPSYHPPTLTASTRYSWYVRAHNALGRATSLAWSFVTRASTTGLPAPTGHTIHISGPTFRTSTDAIWHWRGVTYFGMFKDYLDGVSLTPAYTWATAIGANLFRVLLMKSPNTTAMPWAPLHPASVTNYYTQLDAFLTAVEAQGFYVEVVALADCTATSSPAWAGLPTLLEKQTHVNAVAAVVASHPRTFLELCNEPYNNGLEDPSTITAPTSGVWLAKGAGAPTPYLPAWHYLTTHAPRESVWTPLAKTVYDYTTLGWDTWPPLAIPGVNDEPMGIAEVAIAGKRTNSAQDCADFYAVAELCGCGSTILAECLSHQGIAPTAATYPETWACGEAIRESWAHVPSDALLGEYTDETLSTCPLGHTSAGATKTIGMIVGNRATCVIVGKTSSWQLVVKAGWTYVSTDGYGGNIVTLTKA